MLLKKIQKLDKSPANLIKRAKSMQIRNKKEVTIDTKVI